MKTITVHTLVVALMATPCAGFADQPAEPAGPAEPLALKNVELNRAGGLSGQFVTHAGLPVSGSPLVIETGRVKHQIMSDEQGRFELKGLAGGRCVIRAGQEVFACQLWAHGTAPPGAISTVAIVASEDATVRGNRLWRPQFIRPGARLAALSQKQAILAGLIVAGGTILIVDAADDDAS